jgi:hypothetical protein
MDFYKFPTPGATQTITALFNLPAHGGEQDWEIELADGTRIAEFLTALSAKSLDLECRSALALLVLHSLTYAEPTAITGEIVAEVRRVIHGDKEVYDRVLSYWSDGFLDHEEFVRSVLR